MKRVFLLILISGIISVSCKKDEAEENQPPLLPAKDYMQLEVGNYWVYQMYVVDSLGNETISGNADSVYISDDTLVNGILYYKKAVSHGMLAEYLRDSSGYIVNLEGELLFSDHDFEKLLRVDTLHPDLCYVEYMMYQLSDTTISIPFGDYSNCLEMRGKVVPLNPAYPYGINYTHYYYSDSIGMVKSSSYWFSVPYRRVEQRLIAFGNTME